MDGSLSFDSNSLQTYNPTTRVGIITNVIDHASIPDKDISLYHLANTNGSALPYTGYPSKKIIVSGTIAGSSQSDLDARIDAFKGYLTGKEKNLDITYNGATRRYTATVNTTSVTRGNRDLMADFSIEFICTNPFGKATAVTNAVNATARTASSYTDNHVFTGSAPCQLPVITITFTAVTGGTGYVSFQNNANGQGITITDQTFIAADVLEIDTVAKTVKKNGTEIDFLGAFPEFAPGSQNFTYSDGFTTRTFNELVAYYPLYL